MKLRHCLAAFAAFSLLAGASPLHAADLGLYLAPKLSLGIQSLSDMTGSKAGNQSIGLDSGYNSAFGIGAAVGFDLYPRYMVPARVEVEYLYMGETKENGTIHWNSATSYEQKNQVNSLFVNAYLDLHNSTAFIPYVGAGLGSATIDSKGHLNGVGLGSHSQTNVAWNVGLGVAMELSYNSSLDIGYRYANFGSAETGVGAGGHRIESDMAMHQFTVGLRFTF